MRQKKSKTERSADIHRTLRTVTPEVRDLLIAAHKQGYRVSKTGNNHLKIMTPEGRPQQTVFAPSTTSDCRAHQRVKIKLRRIGVEL